MDWRATIWRHCRVLGPDQDQGWTSHPTNGLALIHLADGPAITDVTFERDFPGRASGR